MVKWDPAKLRTLSDLTEENHHLEAYILGSMMIGASEIEKELREIARLRDQRGDLDHILGRRRDRAYYAMMDHAKKVLTEEQLDKFYGCF